MHSELTCSQSSGLEMCTVDDELKKTLRKFRFRKAKNSAAIISGSRVVVVSNALCSEGGYQADDCDGGG